MTASPTPRGPGRPSKDKLPLSLHGIPLKKALGAAMQVPPPERDAPRTPPRRRAPKTKRKA